MTDTEDQNRRLAEARDSVARGKQALAEGQETLRQLLGEVRAARPRGLIRQLIWDCQAMAEIRAPYFSQSGQDAYLDHTVFRGKRSGCFVEIGGYDGVTGSNCLFFELIRGWSGIVIEPSPRHHAKAASFRRAPCLQLAVAAEPGEAEFMDIRSGYVQMSGLTESYAPALLERVEANPRHRAETIRVETRRLDQILDAQGLEEIDYVSLDVEGAELAILESFPFEKYSITAWTIENPDHSAAMPELMRDKGYRLIEAIGADDVYVRVPD